MAKKGKKEKGKKSKDKRKSSQPQVPTKLPIITEPPKPKPDPCLIECPLYIVIDVRKCLRSPTYDDKFGPNDEFIYFKELEELQAFLEELKSAHERKQQRQEACINQILERYAPEEFNYGF